MLHCPMLHVKLAWNKYCFACYQWGARVSPETLERVRAVIRKFDYQPNLAARILKGERTRTIGLIIPSVADSFFAACAEAAQDIARAHGFLLIVTCSNNDPRVELENLNTLVQHRVDGSCWLLRLRATTSWFKLSTERQYLSSRLTDRYSTLLFQVSSAVTIRELKKPRASYFSWLQANCLYGMKVKILSIPIRNEFAAFELPCKRQISRRNRCFHHQL